MDFMQLPMLNFLAAIYVTIFSACTHSGASGNINAVQSKFFAQN